MVEYGWDLEPSTSGSPSKRYWKNAKRVAEAMRACRAMAPPDLINVSPVDGSDGAPPPRDLFGRQLSSDENPASPHAETPDPPTPSPVRLGPDSLAQPNTVPEPTPPPVEGGDSRVNDVLKREELGSLSVLLDGWSQEEQLRPTSAGHRVLSDTVFQDGLSVGPANFTRGDSDIMTRTLSAAGAKRVPQKEFWALGEDGNGVAVSRGRDFHVLFAPTVTNFAWLKAWAARRVKSRLSIPLRPRPILRRAFVRRLPVRQFSFWPRTNKWDCPQWPRLISKWGIRFIPTNQA